MQMSDEFIRLVREIGETRSKDEEIAIVHSEVAKLRALCKTNEGTALLVQGKKGTKSDGLDTAKRLRELLVRLIYCEMLGQPVPFGYMLAMNCTQFPRLAVKRTGYLAVSLMLNPNDELNLLNTSTIHKSLESPNYLEVCIALNTLCRLVTAKTVGFFYPVVKELLQHHKRPVVRKKAVSAIYAMLCTNPNPDDVRGHEDLFRDALCDKDPSVMVATLGVLREILGRASASANEEDGTLGDVSSVTSKWTDLVQPLVAIQNQVIGKRLPRGYDYTGMPAPWVQMHLIDLLGMLGRDNQAASEKMYECLLNTFRAALSYKQSVAAMVTYSCIKTIMSIIPNTQLMEAASKQIGVFLRSTSPNLRYLGIRALATALNETRGQFAQVLANDEQHQLAVIECLESDDDTLRRETLDVLYLMSTPSNAPVIAERLLGALRRDTHDTGNVHVRSELIVKITQLAEKYAPSKEWYLQTFTSVLDLGGDLVRPDVAETLISTFDTRRTAMDTAYIQGAVDMFARLVTESLLPGARKMPPLLCRVACWLLGEHGQRCSTTDVPTLLRSLVDLGERNQDNPQVLSVLVTAVAKLSTKVTEAPPCVLLFINRYKSSRNIGVAQRCIEGSALLGDVSAKTVLSQISSPVRVDQKLSFLSNFISAAVANGAKPYNNTGLEDEPVDLIGLGSTVADDDKLQFAAYPTPKDPLSGSSAMIEPMPMTNQPVLEPFNALTGTNEVSSAGAGDAPIPSEPAAAPTTGLFSAALGSSTRKGGWSASGFKAAGASTTSSSSATSSPFESSAPQSSLNAASSSSSGFDSVFGGASSASTETPARTTPASTPVKQLTQEERRRQSAARSLFGTMSGSSTPRSKAASGGLFAAATDVSSSPEPTPAPAAAPAPKNALDDLLGGFGSTSSTTTTAPAAASSSSKSTDLMSDLFGPSPATSSAPTAAAKPAPASFDSLLGGFSSTPAVQPQQTSSSFGFLQHETSGGSVATSAPPPSLTLSSVTSSTYLSSEVTPYAPSGAALNFLCTQKTFSLYCLPLARPDCHGVAFFIHNTQPHDDSVKVSISVQSLAEFTVAMHPSMGISSAEGLNKLILSRVPPRTTFVGLLKLVRAQQTLPLSPVAFTGSFAIGMAASCQFKLPPVDAKSFLRPSKYTTQRIGNVWAKHSCEKKVTMQISSIQQATQKLESALNVNTASVIGTEAILCNVLAFPPPQEVLVLYHCRIDKGSAIVAIRSQSAVITDAIVATLQQQL